MPVPSHFHLSFCVRKELATSKKPAIGTVRVAASAILKLVGLSRRQTLSGDRKNAGAIFRMD